MSLVTDCWYYAYKRAVKSLSLAWASELKVSRLYVHRCSFAGSEP
jgi:hypothetical protein